jgi:hypothetical protein
VLHEKACRNKNKWNNQGNESSLRFKNTIIFTGLAFCDFICETTSTIGAEEIPNKRWYIDKTVYGGSKVIGWTLKHSRTSREGGYKKSEGRGECQEGEDDGGV